MIRISNKKIEALFKDILQRSRFSSIDEYLIVRLSIDADAAKKFRLKI